jgi:[protein-PII] uridylyltransferase
MAHLAGTVENLKALALVSWADVGAVAPGVMTSWRAGQLWSLYLAAYQELTRELDSERIHGDPGAVVPFLEGFPTRYLRTHDAREMEAHLRLEEASRATGVATSVEKLDGAWRLTLVARDRPLLFASVAGTLSAWGMNILKVEAFANRAGIVLDTFLFADPLRTLELNPPEADRLRATVERVLAGRVSVRDLLKSRPKANPPSRKSVIPPTVALDPEASRTATLIQIVAQDRPGLLYDLASAISAEGCNIEVVLVDTEAHKAIDVFYVTAGGAPLDAARQQRLAAAMRAACAPAQ